MRGFDPVLLDIPESFDTQRLTLRRPRPGDGAGVNAAIRASLDELAPWMPWVHPVPKPEDTESWCRTRYAHFVQRQSFNYLLYLRGTETFVGSAGMPRLDWDVPRFEIGYWTHTPYAGQGYMAEAVAALTALCFEKLNAARVEIHCDERNERSRRIPVRLGFTLEGTLRNDARDPAGNLRNTCVYSRIEPLRP